MTTSSRSSPRGCRTHSGTRRQLARRAKSSSTPAPQTQTGAPRCRTAGPPQGRVPTAAVRAKSSSRRNRWPSLAG
eukprot:4499947-Prymnesium_polylepis.1